MNSREVVLRTIEFANPDRLALSLPEEYGNDFVGAGMSPSPDARPSGVSATDEWGCEWENLGISRLGEVRGFPLRTWDDFESLNVPDVLDPKRWAHLENVREQAGDKFLMMGGVSLYERAHFLRGLENLWADIYTAPDELGALLDLLVEMNVKAVKRYGELGGDGLIFCDDWGLQDRLMISPDAWRKLWKPRYARVYDAAHEAGMKTFLHSCGHIVEILDDLIETGLDVIQMDQQRNMGLDRLRDGFAGRITFWCPVDIQAVMVGGTPDEIRAYCREMVEKLGTPEGGFIAKWYGDPKSAGHTPEAVAAMSEEFVRLSEERRRSH